MRVAIGPVFDEFGGVSQHILGIKKYSSNKVDVIPSNITRKSLAANFCRNYFNNQWLLIRYYQQLMDQTRLNHYDVVHSHANVWFTNLCQMSRNSKCKWVHTYHTLYFEEDYVNGLNEAQIAQNRFLINIASKADVRISISKWLHDYLDEKYSIQTEIIPNGVDLDACDKANPHKFTKKYGLTNFVLFLGYLDPIKNPRLFIEMTLQMPETNFVMIGRNISASNIKTKYGITIPQNLTLINEMKHEDVLSAIAASGAFVMTSKREGIPTALLEAMGMEKPVVAPFHSGCKEIVCNKKYGFLYEPNSLDDLIEKTHCALTSKHIGKNAREKVLLNYDWKVLAKKIDTLWM